MNTKFDYVIIGGGIVGLCIARRLALQNTRILVIEKEAHTGAHASGRNSGVLHSGIYYPPNSLKAKFCRRGAELMKAYVQEKNLPSLTYGKVVVAQEESDVQSLQKLYKQGLLNGAKLQLIDEATLREIEPEARTCKLAIHSPETFVVSPKYILKELEQDLRNLGVTFAFGEEALNVNWETKKVSTNKSDYAYGEVFNCAGTYADVIAHSAGVGLQYQIMPFRGFYRIMKGELISKIRGNIYPTPNPDLPFLGVHVTKTPDGKVWIGPSAMPALGRENYQGFESANIQDTLPIFWKLSKMFAKNTQGLRNLVFSEIKNYPRTQAAKALQRLVPAAKLDNVGPIEKVGIRAQLFDTKQQKFEMDFVALKGKNSVHVLNAVSPGFTSAMSFAEYVVEQVTTSSTSEKEVTL